MTDAIAVSKDISPDDEMFAGNADHYFGVGQSALDCIERALFAAKTPPDRITRILDLPCGHGRVMRYLRLAFPAAEIAACDLSRAGVDYCAKAFGATPVYSDVDPRKIPIAESSFDLIWVGSLLTHIESGRWKDFLEVFQRSLRPGGILMFTAHGRFPYDLTVRGKTTYGLSYWTTTGVRYGYERTGFAYADYPGTSGYGHSLSDPRWVFGQIAAIPEMRIVHFSERAWDNHQDVFACVRDPEWQVSHPQVSWWTAFKHRMRARMR